MVKMVKLKNIRPTFRWFQGQFNIEDQGQGHQFSKTPATTQMTEPKTICHHMSPPGREKDVIC